MAVKMERGSDCVTPLKAYDTLKKSNHVTRTPDQSHFFFPLLLT